MPVCGPAHLSMAGVRVLPSARSFLYPREGQKSDMGWRLSIWCVCVRACVHVCVRACVRACVWYPSLPCGFASWSLGEVQNLDV
jgi:hypothetical protein